MKLLLTALLCLLLTGCSPSPEMPPAEAAPSSREMTARLQAQYSNAVEAVFLPFEDIRNLFSTNGGLLLQSEHALTLLDMDFQVIAARTLDFVPAVSVTESGISVFDPHSKLLLLLDFSLQERLRLSLPSECTGNPVTAENCVYYCTAGSIYCWDLESGIRRRIRETAYTGQTLIGIHRDNAVLQCRVREEDLERDLFLDSQTGQLLRELDTTARLETLADRFYCIFPSGSSDNLIFGTDPENPMGFFPDSLCAPCTFLPESHAALTLEDSLLSCYDLETGLLRDTLTLHHIPSILLEADGSIFLLISQENQDFLLKWQPENTLSGSSRTGQWYTADNPDHAGLSRCRDYAQRLSETYGVEIRIWKEAVAVSPWDYALTPEHRYPVLLAQLKQLEQCLARYPETVLSQTCAHFDSLKICLVQDITGLAEKNSLSAATGIQFLSGKDAYVVLASGAYLEQALYHEFFHLMETLILSRSNALDRWNELNPAGFSYDLDHSANARRNSSVYLEGSYRAFVDTYSMSFPKEDRARIFEYAMLPDMEHLFQSQIMQSKLYAICTGVRDAYGLKQADYPLPWEAYLQ